MPGVLSPGARAWRDEPSREHDQQAGEKDHLFGSVTSADLAEALDKKGFDIDRRKIQLAEPLRNVGEYDVPIKLHREVTARFKVIVKKEEGE